MKHTIWGLRRDGRVEILSTVPGETPPEGAEKICSAWKSELRKLIPFFGKQAKKMSPREIRERYYLDDRPKTEIEKRTVTVDSDLRVDFKPFRYNGKKYYSVQIVPSVLSDNPAPIRVWSGICSDKALEIVRFCQEKIKAGWRIEQIEQAAAERAALLAGNDTTEKQA